MAENIVSTPTLKRCVTSYAARTQYRPGAVRPPNINECETVDGLRRRIDEAGRYLSLDQLAISPQCGFASSVADNLISDDDQKRKLEVVVETARQVWG